MGVRINEIVVDCLDPHRLAAFWCAVLGWVVTDSDEDEVEVRPAGTDDRTSPVPSLMFGRVAEPKAVKDRLHLDVVATTGSDQAAELERLLALGATPLDIGQGPVSWHVLADPEGNEFCLLRGVVEPGT
jgi:predicted enzyme related to lactoylglutathione lyase